MLLHELAEPAADLLRHHLDHQREWFPHELVPYTQARSYTDKDPWRAEDYPMAPGVRSALFVNLLTEDNLPYYTDTILGAAPRDHPFNTWGRVWTGEEGRHSIVMGRWIETTRALDPEQLERARLKQMGTGEVPEPPSLAELLVYTSLQELATQVAHRNTSRALDRERGGKKVMGAVAGDEGMHREFYSGLAAAGFEVDPSTMMIASLTQIRDFDMPGKNGIPDFKRHTKAIANAGIYGVSQFVDDVVRPTLQEWELMDKDEGAELQVGDVDGLNAEGEIAREQLNERLAQLTRVKIKYQARSERLAAAEA